MYSELELLDLVGTSVLVMIAKTMVYHGICSQEAKAIIFDTLNDFNLKTSDILPGDSITAAERLKRLAFVTYFDYLNVKEIKQKEIPV